MLSMVISLRSALKGGRVWVVGPTYKQTMENWTYLQRLVQQMPKELASVQLSEYQVSFAGGGSIQMRTGDNPDNLRGAGLDGVVLDEAASMKPEVWDTVLRPALADRGGWAFFISSPLHYNHFFDWFERGQDASQTDWASWQFPTWTNPYIAEAEIEAARRDMSAEDFEQEIAASFTAIGGAVWPTLGANRPLFYRPRPAGLEFVRVGVGIDYGTTEAHQWNVTCDGLMKSGFVWQLSSKLSPSGSLDDILDEAQRCRKDYGATEAYYDRSQGALKDPLIALGYQAEPGLANVEARNGVLTGRIQRKTIAWDAAGPGNHESFVQHVGYHRYPSTHTRAGQIVEEDDDAVDGSGYVLAGLSAQRAQIPLKAVHDRDRLRKPAVTVRGGRWFVGA